MKAILLTGFGGTDMLRYGDAPDPVAGPGDVVVDVYAASVNAADSKVRRGLSGDLTFPHILGRDFSGVVSTVGTGVDDLTVGDAVFGVTERGVECAYAEKLAIKAAIVAKKPPQLSHIEAAAIHTSRPPGLSTSYERICTSPPTVSNTTSHGPATLVKSSVW